MAYLATPTHFLTEAALRGVALNNFENLEERKQISRL